MTVDTLSDEKLAEIARGCEGVTPGPWVPSTFGSQVLTGDSWNTVCIFYEGAGNGPIANAKRNFQLAAWEDGRGATRIDANAFHIARLDPSTVLSLVTEVQSSRGLRGEMTAPNYPLIERINKVLDTIGENFFAKDEWTKGTLMPLLRDCRAELTTARADGIEEAAKVAESWEAGSRKLAAEARTSRVSLDHELTADMAHDIALSIRALSPPANEPDETEVTG